MNIAELVKNKEWKLRDDDEIDKLEDEELELLRLELLEETKVANSIQSAPLISPSLSCLH